LHQRQHIHQSVTTNTDSVGRYLLRSKSKRDGFFWHCAIKRFPTRLIYLVDVVCEKYWCSHYIDIALCQNLRISSTTENKREENVTFSICRIQQLAYFAWLENG